MTQAQELAHLPKLRDGTCRIVPLGGLGDVGRNMTVFELNGKLLIVDAGVLFPEEVQPGVDLILPDFDYIKHRLHDVVAIVLTHGHEDHIWCGSVSSSAQPKYSANRHAADPSTRRI